jgi:hypothetical protein
MRSGFLRPLLAAKEGVGSMGLPKPGWWVATSWERQVEWWWVSLVEHHPAGAFGGANLNESVWQGGMRDAFLSILLAAKEGVGSMGLPKPGWWVATSWERQVEWRGV